MQNESLFTVSCISTLFAWLSAWLFFKYRMAGISAHVFWRLGHWLALPALCSYLTLYQGLTHVSNISAIGVPLFAGTQMLLVTVNLQNDKE